MHVFRGSSLLRLGIVTAFLLLLLPVAAPVAAQSDSNSYTSDEYGFILEWTDTWKMGKRSSSTTIDLWRDEAVLVTIRVLDGSRVSPQDAVAPGREDVVLADHRDADPPRIVVESSLYNGEIDAVGTYEAYSINDGDVTLLVSFITPALFQETMLEMIPQELTINGTPLLAGQNIADTPMVTDLTGESTPSESSEGVTRTSRGNSSNETPEPTGDADTGVTRTPRTRDTEPTAEPTSEVNRTSRSGTAEETPEATESPTETAPASVPEGMETFTGPVFGYTVQYDPSIWEMDAEIQDEGVDGIRLLSGNSTFTIWAWDGYGSNPVACLDGEAEFYSSQDDRITGWEPIIGADGEPLRYESDDLAWGVFRLTYTNSNGDAYTLIDYISCEPIPDQDAVLIVLLSSGEESYNADLDLALDVLDTLTFGEPPAEGNNVGQSTGVEINTNLDGSLYTSPNFGYTVDIPLEWSVLDESSTSTDEQIVVNNGTSTVTLWGTSSYSGGLRGCVDFAAESSGLDLSVDIDADGGEFRGSYRDAAFANFVYERDGEQWMYFVNCRPIGDTGAFLIVIQDVPYSEFTSERRARTDIENSIVMP